MCWREYEKTRHDRGLTGRVGDRVGECPERGQISQGGRREIWLWRYFCHQWVLSRERQSKWLIGTRGVQKCTWSLSLLSKALEVELLWPSCSRATWSASNQIVLLKLLPQQVYYLFYVVGVQSSLLLTLSLSLLCSEL